MQDIIIPSDGECHRVGSVETHGKRFRVKRYRIDGSQLPPASFPLDRRDLAEAFRDTFRANAQDRSLGAAITDYLDYLKRVGGTKGRPLKSTKVVRSKLEGIFQLVPGRTSYRGRKRPPSVGMSDRLLKTITPTEAHRLYGERTRAVKSNGKPISVDTHRSELIYAKKFMQWCAHREWVKLNPFEEVMPVGELSRGKDQLKGIDEARAFARVAYQDKHPFGGMAAVAVLTLGLRAMELLDRRPCDLDDNGNVLVIREYTDAAGTEHTVKSSSSLRRIGLPPILKQWFQWRCSRIAPTEYIFGTMTSNTLLEHVRRLCEVAGVTSVCTHGLRGTQITLTVEIDTLVKGASKSAGHSDTGVTRAHYLAAGVEQSARARLMEEMLLADDTQDEEAIEAAEREAREAMAKLEALRAGKTARLGITPAGDMPSNVVPMAPFLARKSR